MLAIAIRYEWFLLICAFRMHCSGWAEPGKRDPSHCLENCRERKGREGKGEVDENARWQLWLAAVVDCVDPRETWRAIVVVIAAAAAGVVMVVVAAGLEMESDLGAKWISATRRVV